MNPPLPPASPNWSPVNYYGGYQSRRKLSKASKDDDQRYHYAAMCGCRVACQVHGHNHLAAAAAVPTSDPRAFRGAVGCGCFVQRGAVTMHDTKPYPPTARSPAAARVFRWLLLLALCGAYLQGGVMKAMAFVPSSNACVSSARSRASPSWRISCSRRSRQPSRSRCYRRRTQEAIRKAAKRSNRRKQ